MGPQAFCPVTVKPNIGITLFSLKCKLNMLYVSKHWSVQGDADDTRHIVIPVQLLKEIFGFLKVVFPNGKVKFFNFSIPKALLTA